MDLKKILHSLENCPCGKKHTFVTEVVEIGSGITPRTGKILADAGFPKKVLLVTDENALGVSTGLLESLAAEGFAVTKLIYPDMRYARMEQVREIEALCGSVDGMISVGTGSVNDVCRVAAHTQNKKFCIFATAPSMDGFASDTSPILVNNFKATVQAEQPSVIIADTKILAKAPLELKAAGFGDIIAKYIGITDWKVSHLVTGEHYCEAVANITMQGVKRVVSLADKVCGEDEEAVAGIMEGLILTGLAMKLAGCSRPASGAEHMISHFWECHKLTRGLWPEFHGKKVGVATVLVNRIYHNLADRVESINPVSDQTDWSTVEAAFDPSLIEDVKRLNTPTVTDEIDPVRLKESWPEIRRIIREELPTDEQMLRMMQTAGAVTEPEEVHVDPELLERGIRYHAYMRHRVYLTRLLPMMGLDVMDYLK